jgi:hypothetical protein
MLENRLLNFKNLDLNLPIIFSGHNINKSVMHRLNDVSSTFNKRKKARHKNLPFHKRLCFLYLGRSIGPSFQAYTRMTCFIWGRCEWLFLKYIFFIIIFFKKISLNNFFKIIFKWLSNYAIFFKEDETFLLWYYRLLYE